MATEQTVMEAVENTLRTQPRGRRKLRGLQVRGQRKVRGRARRPKYREPESDLTPGEEGALEISEAVAGALSSGAPRTGAGQIMARIASGVHTGAKIGTAVSKYRRRKRRKATLSEDAMNRED